MVVLVDKEKCTGCEACIEICPVEAIKLESDKVAINDECVECCACVDECPNGAISSPA